MQLLIYISKRICRKTWLAVAMSCVVYVLPFCGVLRMMLPFFWLGYALFVNYEKMLQYKDIALIIALASAMVSLCLWTPSLLDGCYNVVSYKLQDVARGIIPLPIIGRIGLRMFSALAFSALFLNLCHCVSSIPRWLQCVGGSTMGIYIIQSVVVESLVPRCVDISGMIWWLRDLVVCPLLSVLLLAICWGIYRILSSKKYLSLSLFGK